MAKASLSRLNEVLEKQNGNVFHVGIDVHKKSFHTAFYGDNGLLETFVCSSGKVVRKRMSRIKCAIQN